MIKIKCDVCSTEHGGFHLCLGRKVNVRAEQYTAIRNNSPTSISEIKARGAAGRWERHWAVNAERDQKIHDMYMNDGVSLRTIGETFGLGKPTIKSIVVRLGGSMRPRNQKAS